MGRYLGVFTMKTKLNRPKAEGTLAHIEEHLRSVVGMWLRHMTWFTLVTTGTACLIEHQPAAEEGQGQGRFVVDYGDMQDNKLSMYVYSL
jgi:hypothetical protein